MKVLFICHANVGRSQMAEAYYNHLTKSNDAFSAGVEDYSKKYPVLPKLLVDLMAEEGIDISAQKPKPLNEKMVVVSDRVFVLCSKDECPSYLFSDKTVFWDVVDPHHMSVEDTRKIRDLIKSKVLSII
ncbi:arsenate reductase ArsC [Candidatus Woesearchaeota archaeon]|nr:arsenate reductase ArsC [Candidatus Woesearchaeota archaeon]MBW3016455.1 arsenate reductase ArsC [Candidatus Woesearchaeota archaeon]